MIDWTLLWRSGVSGSIITNQLGMMLTVLVGLITLLSVLLADATSLRFGESQAGDYDYGLNLVIPSDFGSGEFTFEIWVWLDNSYPVGSTASGEGQRRNWSNADNPPYSSMSWWWAGNFLLDGHNNASFRDGTFSLQFFGGGRVRWLFGDGIFAGPGGHWSVGAYPAAQVPTLLDGNWHHLALVRRFADPSGSDLELWVDGVMIATEWSSARTDMRSYWDAWAGYPTYQEGWFWGCEKQAAIGVMDQYEDFKGLMGEIRYSNLARPAADLAANWAAAVAVSTPGLVGLFRVNEGAGNVACDALESSRCMDLINMNPGYWSDEGPPIGEIVFRDGFEYGAVDLWGGGS